MWVTATQLAAEIGCHPKTIKEHAMRLEAQGIRVTTMIGRPKQYNRELFLSYQYGGEYVKEGSGIRMDDAGGGTSALRLVRGT